MDKIHVEIVMLWCAVTLCALTIYDLLATVSEIDYYLASNHGGGNVHEKIYTKENNVLYPKRHWGGKKECNCEKIAAQETSEKSET